MNVVGNSINFHITFYRGNLKLFRLGVEQIELAVRPAYQFLVFCQLDIADAVGLERTVISRTCLIVDETVTVVAVESIPGAQPNIANAVLNGIRHEAFRETVFLVKMLDAEFLLLTKDGRAEENKK